MQKNVVVLSVSGFVGSELAAFWKSRSDLNLIDLDSVRCNLLDPLATRQAIDALPQPFALVFLSTIRRDPLDDLSVYQRNVAMITHLLEATRSKSISHLIFASSVCVYGRPPRELPLTETSLVLPSSHYGLSKHVSEQLLRWNLSCPLTILRLPGTFGRNDKGKSVVSQFLEKIRTRQTIFLDHAGTCRRDFLYIQDLVEVINDCLARSVHGLFNVTSGDPQSMHELTIRLGKALNIRPTIAPRHSDETPFDLVFDRSHLLGSFPHVSFTRMDDAVRAILDERGTPEEKGNHEKVIALSSRRN